MADNSLTTNGQGSAMIVNNSAAEITHSQFLNNNLAGGIGGGPLIVLQSDPTMNNTVFYDNPGQDTIVLDFGSTGDISHVTMGGDTMTQALLPSSPAIDVGDDATCPDHDQRGFTRIDQDGNFDGGSDNNPCDIGAFERNPLQLNGIKQAPGTARLTWIN